MILGALLTAVLLETAMFPAALADGGSPPPVKFLADWSLAPGTLDGKTLIGGLSGIAYDAAKHELIAISDDKGNSGPVRFHRFKLTFSSNRLSLEPAGFTPLLDAQGKKWHRNRLDPEGIALLGDHVLVASEGVRRNRK